ncbi:Uncharacterized conserved protein, DUF305 family [Georgenia satyanarayanai]|uniref:Uncharacterized conserved protein, DUF305 family n=1 Tax=Georgenia satyanarayanai TaxID=860221 RepID=A0A2Y9ANN7_9MICO|nr:DUF305 domain-containing protein [Georgenia satyanarayanai]PYF97300.1 uncharacterized protein (DUF305 family) [Georgenia satyanarayanai]SSA46081.1 Uncharacterized conserved protein, DUF305 family [Georgenia satyanarayanai]
MTLRTRLAAVAGGIALTLALAACGDGGETTPEEPAAGTAAEETTGSATEAEDVHNDADTMFAQMMIVHHEGAIEMADLAVEKADSEEVRSLAERISAAQGPEIEKMTSWLEAWGEETSPMGGMEGMDHGDMDMEGMSQEEAMADLESLSGAEFDQRFLELMIAHHRGAVDMAQEELDGGENPQALELAQKIIDDQQAEITEMEELLQGL